jgi:glycerol-3-phosphate O-acyltransferase
MGQYTIQTNEEDIRTVIPKDEFDLTLFKTLIRSVQELEKIVSEQGTEIDKLRKSNSRLRSDINRVVNFVRSNHG